MADTSLFHVIQERRFASPRYTSGELGALAARKLLDRVGVSPGSVDLIITSALFTDLLAVGIGADVQHRIGATEAAFLNLNNNCTSWISALNVARAFIESKIHERVLIVTVTNFVSRLTEMLEAKHKACWTLGDGASATLVVAEENASEGGILALHEESFGPYFAQVRYEPGADRDGRDRRYWEGGTGPMTVNYNESMVNELTAHGARCVPDAVHRVLRACNLSASDIDLFVTHQPNRTLVDQWRESVGIKPPRAHDTLERYGNMAVGSVPVSLADAIDKGLVERGDLIASGTFANSGEHVSALIMRW
jgi:3-oxoacyl-[acyl-carrier-protein] synthase III